MSNFKRGIGFFLDSDLQKKIKKEMIEKELTVLDVAEYCEVGRAQIYLVLQGKRSSLHVYQKFEKLFNVEILPRI